MNMRRPEHVAGQLLRLVVQYGDVAHPGALIFQRFTFRTAHDENELPAPIVSRHKHLRGPENFLVGVCLTQIAGVKNDNPFLPTEFSQKTVLRWINWWQRALIPRRDDNVKLPGSLWPVL